MTHKEFLAYSQTKREQEKLARSAAAREAKRARMEADKTAQENKHSTEEEQLKEGGHGDSAPGEGVKPPRDEGIKPAEKPASASKNSLPKPTFPKKQGQSPSVGKRPGDADGSGVSRKRRRFNFVYIILIWAVTNHGLTAVGSLDLQTAPFLEMNYSMREGLFTEVLFFQQFSQMMFESFWNFGC